MSKELGIRKTCNQLFAKDTYGVSGALFGLAAGVSFLSGGTIAPMIMMIACGAQLYKNGQLNNEVMIFDFGNKGFYSTDPHKKGQGYVVTEGQNYHLLNSSEKTQSLLDDLKKAKSERQIQKLRKKLAREERFRNDVLSSRNVLEAKLVRA